MPQPFQLHFQIVDSVIEPPLVVAFVGGFGLCKLHNRVSVAVFAVEFPYPGVTWYFVREPLISVVERRRASITVVNRDPVVVSVAAVLDPFVLRARILGLLMVPPPVIVFLVAKIPPFPAEVQRVWLCRQLVTTVEFLIELEGEVVRLGHWHLEPDIAPDHPENIPIHTQLLPDLLELADCGVGQPDGLCRVLAIFLVGGALVLHML